MGRHAAQLTRMKEILDQSQRARRPLDLAGQHPQRRQERSCRKRAIAFARWAHHHRLPRGRAAAHIGLRPGTLGRWDRTWQADYLKIHPLGRRRLHAQPIQCLQVNQYLHELGPTLGLPALRSQFPQLPRSELGDLQRDYRRQWFSQHPRFAEVLQWLIPGSVWADDFSQTPVPIEFYFHHLLAVRDLASRKQLSMHAAVHADARTAVDVLEYLFTTCGAPLILKSDWGSPFIANIFQELLARWHVIPLLSPPYWPQYNGAVEAGFGWTKTRIHIEAARHGRFDHWTLDDVEAARQLANSASRPWGQHGPTPQQRWDQRLRITAEQRQLFRQTVQQDQQIVFRELGYVSDEQLDCKARAAVVREAISRALVGLGYLTVQRKRIPPPFNLSFGANIT